MENLHNLSKKGDDPDMLIRKNVCVCVCVCVLMLTMHFAVYLMINPTLSIIY